MLLPGQTATGTGLRDVQDSVQQSQPGVLHLKRLGAQAWSFDGNSCQQQQVLFLGKHLGVQA